MLQAVHIIEQMGPSLGLHISFAKCELFSSKGNASFPPAVKCSLLPNQDILGAPVGDYLHCSRFIANKCAESKKLLSSLVDVAGVDLQVAFTLLRMCGGFCKMVHLTRVTPPSVASDALAGADLGGGGAGGGGSRGSGPPLSYMKNDVMHKNDVIHTVIYATFCMLPSLDLQACTSF